MTHPDVPAEQAHVDHAYQRLEAMRAAASAMLQEAFGERGSTFQSFTERDIRVRTSLSRLEHLQIGSEALVFGRIDRVAEAPGAPADPARQDAGRAEIFHIGRLAVSAADQEPLVVDWRAPIAEPFYRATGAHPMGLSRRRHFLTEGRRVLDLEDEYFSGEDSDGELGLGLSGSQVLLAALQRSRTGRMRDIVATVQREQDQIIRGPLGGILVVQGGPGTGKTAVALHRAAYLLYTHRFPLERQGVLVVGPNPTFLRYIEHVLPSLGESGVELSTVSGLFGETRPTATEDPASARLKGDPRMARFLARAVSDRQRPLRRTVLIPYGRALLRLTPEASAQLVAATKRRGGTHNARRRILETLLWRYLLTEVERRAPIEEVGAGVELPETLTADELGASLRRVPEVVEALDRIWPVLTPQDLLHDLFGAPPLIELAGRRDLTVEERMALHRPRSASQAEVAWSDADIALLDEARALLGTARRRPATEGDGIRSYGHVVVDEAQDLSPMQLRMLGRRSLSGSMTMVGDIAQATGAWAPESWRDVVGHLPARRDWRLVELTVNYRTPSEIMDVAGRLLASVAVNARPPEAVRASGEPPRVLSVDPPAAPPRALAALTVRTTIEELDAVSSGPGGDGTVAIIAPPSLLDAIGDELVGTGVPFGRVGEGGGLDAVVSLLAVVDAKGLEFDSVVVVEPSRLAREGSQGLRSVYVALTRATRRLAIVHLEPLPEVLAAPVEPAEDPAPSYGP